MIRCDRLIVVRAGHMVVDRLTLSVAPGEALAVIGPAGAGKSSLLGAIAGAVSIQGGDVTLAGHSLRQDPDVVRDRVGYAPSHLIGWPAVRADDFLALFAAAAGLSGRPLRAAVERALAFAGLAGRGETMLDSLPDGTAKLLLIARAVLHEPEAIVLDDPFSNLDPRQRHAVERLVGDAHIGGRCVIASVDDACIPECFTHLALLRDGGLVHHGPAEFATVAAGHAWRHRFRCPGRSAAAAMVLGRLGHAIEVIDADTLECVLECDVGSGRPPAAELTAMLVRAGIPVEAVGPYPHWAAQWLYQSS